jgi:hypothetical protein
MKRNLMLSLVALTVVLIVGGCMRLNKDTGYVELTPLSFDRQSMADTAAAADAVIPDWLMILGGLGIPSVESIGLLWKRLKARNVSLARAEAIGGGLVMNIQAIRKAAAAKNLTLDEINQLLTTIQTATPEVIQFVEQVKRELNVPPVEAKPPDEALPAAA